MESYRGCYLQEDIGGSKDGVEVFHKLGAEGRVAGGRSGIRAPYTRDKMSYITAYDHRSYKNMRLCLQDRCTE